ncbi:tRNA lysidine(34) synthetase TilS [Gellertiella hungarica]|uniref:tRNA(Ile)-lysidine synthase n=1 Tax=Gellertiella hungarica TaxID=1572859 RepID=A0A7W6NJC9_9HYPH|nr:tRNA lysidine(34) synthetase TilS [Gellertiella hungarica]MBB4063172.1 tRNA(Ile)-lysidine synthase [Gellertiella hungarica]
MPQSAEPGPYSPDDPALPVVTAVHHFLDSFVLPGPLLIALSGGSDSTALFHALRHALSEREPHGFALRAATVDHGLRSGSREEALAVAALCARFGIPHRILRWEGEKPASGLQAAARAARYRLLAGEAERTGAVAIVTGHTANDQRETIAMRARRGPGPGLAGMAEAVLACERAWVLRPLLHLEREDLRAALRRWGEEWLDDPSNGNMRFERVRLRMAGEGEARGLSAGERLRSSGSEADWLSSAVRVSEGAVAFLSPDAITEAAEAGLFRLSAAMGGRAYPPERDARSRMMAWLETGMLGRRTLGGTVFDRRRDGLYLYREARGLLPATLSPGEVLDGRYRLAGPEGARLSIGWPTEPESAVVRRLEAAGIPSGVARRAALAVPVVAEERQDGPCRLMRILAGQADFVPGFDRPAAEALRQLFDLPPLPPLPVRQ